MTLIPAPLMVALVTHWLRSGIADQIIHAVRNEASGRQKLAAQKRDFHSTSAGEASIGQLELRCEDKAGLRSQSLDRRYPRGPRIGLDVIEPNDLDFGIDALVP
jgi:hypothetical protein